MPVATTVAVTAATSCVPPADERGGACPSVRAVMPMHRNTIAEANAGNLRMTPPVGAFFARKKTRRSRRHLTQFLHSSQLHLHTYVCRNGQLVPGLQRQWA